MSLEQSIQELTDAVKLLTARLPQLSPAESEQMAQAKAEVIKQTEAIELIEADKIVTVGIEKRATEKAKVKKPETTSKTTTDTSPISGPESAPVSYDDVKKATNALSAAKGREVTIDTLSRFGVKRATELDAAQWADYIAYAKEMTGVSMTGEADE